MSLGWLTESSLLPRKQKEIKADNGSLFDLKAVLMTEKQKVQKQGIDLPSRKIYHISKNQPTKTIKNKGVDQRNQKDLDVSTSNQSQRIKDSYKILKNKEKIYNSLSQNSKNHNSLLVDFISKEIENPSSSKQQYDKLRQDFYQGKLSELRQTRENTQVNDNIEKDLRERLAWEREILEELKGETIEGKLKVVQSFDNKLSKDEKEALIEVLEEKIEEKKRLEETRIRRSKIEGEKIRKLKKLNILESGDEKN